MLQRMLHLRRARVRFFVLTFVTTVLATAILLPGLVAVGAAALSGTLDRGTNTSGEGYLLFSLAALSDVSGITVTMTAGTDYIGLFDTDQSVIAKPLPFEDTPWRFFNSRDYLQNGSPQPTATFTLTPARRTRYLLVLARHNNGTGAPTPASLSVTGAAVSGAPTATPTATPTSNNGTPAAQCHDLGDGAVDQNFVSVDVWAPGLRRACGQLGYENGDNPMPAGTPLPPPRPFRFDYAYDHNEPVHGFKVFYWNGDANHCGDMRLIFHQGGAVTGFTIRYHTFQFAIALCDGAGNKRIIDVGGQADTGALVLESQPSNPIGTLPDSGAMRFTADINSCSGRPGSSSGGCVTAWYPEFDFDVPGNVMAGVSVELSVVRPITLADPNNLSSVVLTNSRGATNWDGVARELGNWVIFNLGSGSQTTWWTVWDVNQGKQVIVPAGTPGAWQMRVDAGIAARGDGVLIANCVFGFGCSRRQHANPVAGIVYPN